MKVRNAYLCESCREVFEGAPYGRCPACNSGALYPGMAHLFWRGKKPVVCRHQRARTEGWFAKTKARDVATQPASFKATDTGFAAGLKVSGR